MLVQEKLLKPIMEARYLTVENAGRYRASIIGFSICNICEKNCWGKTKKRRKYDCYGMCGQPERHDVQSSPPEPGSGAAATEHSG